MAQDQQLDNAGGDALAALTTPTTAPATETSVAAIATSAFDTPGAAAPVENPAPVENKPRRGRPPKLRPEPIAAAGPSPQVPEAVSEPAPLVKTPARTRGARPKVAKVARQGATLVQPHKAVPLKPAPASPQIAIKRGRKPAAAAPLASPALAGPAHVAAPARTRLPEAAKNSGPQGPTLKDKIMDMTSSYATGYQDTLAGAQGKIKEAFEKGSSMLGEAGEFARGNVEACVESGKILATGLQDLGTSLAAEGRTSFETLTADIKELAAAKSPADFLKLQSELMRKSFDNVVAYSSKNSEAMLKLASEAFAPISGRVTLAVDKARTTI